LRRESRDEEQGGRTSTGIFWHPSYVYAATASAQNNFSVLATVTPRSASAYMEEETEQASDY